MHSARPAARSASRPPAPRRGRDVDRGGRPPLEHQLELGGREGQAGVIHRALGRRQQPQDAAALGRPAGQARRDEVGQRARERRAPQLPPRRDQLLDDERRPRRPLRDQDDDRRRRPFAVDPLDQAGDLAPRERRQVHPDRRPQAGLDDRQVLAQGVLPREPVGLVGEHERDPLVACDAGVEGGERPGRRVGRVEVLEHEHDRALRGDPPQPAQERLQGPRLPSLGIGEVAGRQARNPLGALGHARQAQQDRAGVVGQQRVDLVVRPLGEQRAERVEHGRPRRIHRSVGLSAEHERGSRERSDPVERLVDEARDAHPGATRHEHGRRRARRGGDDRVGDPGELRLAADEPSTDHASRHTPL